MKTNKIFLLSALLPCFFILMMNSSCKKDNNDANGEMWDPAWLVGTWEGTTPSSVTPFENTKIRIVIEAYNLESHDTVPNGSSKGYAYSGTLTWDVDGLVPWSMEFYHENYPIPDYNVILWSVLSPLGGQTVNNLSLRVNDTTQLTVTHYVTLDWGPFVDATGDAPGYFDLYGDIDIDNNGNLLEAIYPPSEGSMIRMTKK